MAIKENYKKKKTRAEKPVERPNIYLILDFQKIIKEFLVYLKYLDSKNSYEFIAERIGETKGTFASMLNAGINSLSSAHAYKLSKIFDFNQHEFLYFENAMAYTRANDHEEKLIRFHTLRSCVPVPFRCGKHKEIEYFRYWYGPVAREVIDHPDFDCNFAKWAKVFVPAIKAKELENIFHSMLDLGYIVEENGKYRQAKKLIQSGSLGEKSTIRMYQNQLFQLGMEAQRLPAKERHLATSCFKTTKEGKAEIDKLLREFQSRIVDIVESHSENANVIYYLNWQVFPASKEL